MPLPGNSTLILFKSNSLTYFEDSYPARDHLGRVVLVLSSPTNDDRTNFILWKWPCESHYMHGARVFVKLMPQERKLVLSAGQGTRD